MDRVARAFLIITALAYTFLLFFIYAYFAELSVIQFTVAGQLVAFTNNTFFYTGLIIPLLVNMLCLAFAALLKKQAIGSAHFFKNEEVKQKMYQWINSLGAVFNLFFASLIAVLFFINNEDGVTRFGFVPLIGFTSVLALLWILGLPLILRKNN